MSGGNLEIREVFPSNKVDRRRFVGLPFRLAEGHEPWNPGMRFLAEKLIDPTGYPPWSKRATSFLVAMRGARIVGRMAVLSPGCVRDRPDAATLAFPDFEDDAEVVDALLAAVLGRVRAWGATSLIGPFNPDLHHDVGILVEGFEHRNALFMGYQPRYYAEHFRRTGFSPLQDFHAWGLFEDLFRRDGRLLRLTERVESNPSFSIRSLELGRYDDELRLMHRLYCAAFADHWGFIPPTWEEFRFIAGDMKRILRPEMMLVAQWDDEPIGFALGVPDLNTIIPTGTGGRVTPGLIWHLVRNRRRVDEVRVMIAGVLPEHRNRGAHLPLFYRIAEAIFSLGYRGGEISWVVGDNEDMERPLELLGSIRTKTWRVYERPVHQ